MVGWMPCCCGCLTYTDDFEDGVLADVWTECAGDWEESGGHLTTSDDEAIIVLEVKADEDVGILNTQIHIRDATGGTFTSVGALYQILIFYGTEVSPCTAVNYWMAEMEILTNTTGKLRLYDPNGNLVDDRDLSFSSEATTFNVCVGLDAITVDSADILSGPLIWDCPEPLNGYWFALKSGNSYPVYWESVEYSDQYDHDPKCPDCDVPCCCGCIESEQPTLTLTIYAPDCAYIDGLDTTMSCSALPGECCVWTTDAPIEFTCENGPTPEFSLDFSMECDPNDGTCTGYQMTVTWPPGAGNDTCCDPNDENVTYGADEDCDCKPLQLTFGPYRLWTLGSYLDPDCCNCCEEFWVVVTE